MAAPFTVAQIIDIAKVSQYLSAVDIMRRGINYGKLDMMLSRTLYVERKSVEWKYGQEPLNTTDLSYTAYYLYDLCGKFALQAQQILLAGGTGSLANIVAQQGITRPSPIESSDGTLIPDGGTSVVIPSLIGYNIIFCRNEYTESQINRGGSYYIWDRATGTLTISPAAANGGTTETNEFFQIYPI